MCLPEDTICRLAEHVEQCGPVVISHNAGEFLVGSEWGKEAPDSDMAGAAAYGLNKDLNEALKEMLEHHSGG